MIDRDIRIGGSASVLLPYVPAMQYCGLPELTVHNSIYERTS